MPGGSASNPVKIQLGDLRKPIQLLTRSDATDVDAAGGAGSPIFTPLFPVKVFAWDQHKKALAKDEAGKLVPTVYHMYTVRFHPSIVAGTYIQDPDYPNKMYIQGVSDPDGTRHFMELDATDVEA